MIQTRVLRSSSDQLVSTTPKQLLRTLEQDPAGRDELVAALWPIATMGMSKRSRRNQQTAGARRDLSALEQELGFALFEVVVEV